MPPGHFVELAGFPGGDGSLDAERPQESLEESGEILLHDGRATLQTTAGTLVPTPPETSLGDRFEQSRESEEETAQNEPGERGPETGVEA
jgi:hypothetical protein